jgi:hypothetical protein
VNTDCIFSNKFVSAKSVHRHLVPFYMHLSYFEIMYHASQNRLSFKGMLWQEIMSGIVPFRFCQKVLPVVGMFWHGCNDVLPQICACYLLMECSGTTDPNQIESKPICQNKLPSVSKFWQNVHTAK